MTLTQPTDRDAEQSLEARYGRRTDATAGRAGGRLRVLLIGGACLVAVLAWVVWATLGQSRTTVGALIQSYDVRSSHQMSVTLQITRTSTSAVHCTVSAIASDHSPVGQTVVTVAAGPSGTRTVTATIKTERMATSADVDGCHE